MYRCGVRLCLYLSVACFANEFYERYDLFNVDNSNQQVFGYKEDVACIVETSEDHITVQLQIVGTFHRTAPVRVLTSAGIRNFRVDACFELHGRSNLLLREQRTNRTMHAYAQRLDVLDFGYDMLRYDHVYSLLYVTRRKELSKYSVSHLITSNGSCKPVSTEPFPTFYDDFLAVENNIYVLSKRTLYRVEPDGSLTYAMDTNTDTLWFQLFPKHPTVMFASGRISEIVIYFIQLSIILFLVYCLKYRVIVRGRGTAYELVPPPIIKSSA